jgi:hypothetical protein
VSPPEVRKVGEMMFGFAKIKCENGQLKVYTQWSENPLADWSKGEDLVLTLPEDVEDLKTLLIDTYVEGVEIGEDGSIILWLRAKI